MARRDGQIISKGEKKWLVRWYEGAESASGKRRYKSKTIHGTKKDAQKFLNHTLRSQDLGTYVEPARLSLNAYLDEWLETAAKPKLASRTFDDYQRILNRYFRQSIGQQRLDSIRAPDIQAVYTQMQEKGLGARTVRMAHSVIRSALAQALRWGMLAQNPATLVGLPKQRRQEKRALDPEEIRKLLAAGEGTRYGVLWGFMLATGCRPGEALGVRWQDLDIERATVTIRRTVSQPRPGRWELKEPKTPKSLRTIPLSPRLIRALVQHRRAQAEYRLQAGQAYCADLDLVFASETGRLIDATNLSARHFKPLIEKAGISEPETITMYTLRHTCATLALQAGVNVRVVAERLGHANASLVLDVYGHVLPGAQEEATAKIERAMDGVG